MMLSRKVLKVHMTNKSHIVKGDNEFSLPSTDDLQTSPVLQNSNFHGAALLLTPPLKVDGGDVFTPCLSFSVCLCFLLLLYTLSRLV